MEQLVSGKRRYASLDDLDVLDAARRDPEILEGGPGPITLDEVQREPGLLRSVKRAIDRDRSPGRFLLTGSANLLLMRQVSESLPGRASYLTLWPMTRREQRGLGRGGRWDELLAAEDGEWRELLGTDITAAEDWRTFARRGGFPTPAVELKAAKERQSGSTATSAPISNAICRISLRSAPCPISAASCARPACVSGSSSIKPSSDATWRCRNRPCTAGSTCWKPPTCSSGCRPTP